MDAKAHSRERFSQFAERYVQTEWHRQGDDLDRLFELAAPQPHWTALDVATGGGHTALKIAPHVHRMIATDYAPTMLDAARQHLTANGAGNVSYCPADAENLPFAEASFDLVTCRIAPHHFPDCFRFTQEVYRVLKPGGRFALQDQALPHDRRAAEYIEAFETLRDPSHHRAYADYEWQGMFLDAGFSVASSELIRREANLLKWAAVQDCPPDVIEHLQIMLLQAPHAVAEWWLPRSAGTDAAAFDHVHVLIVGIKPAG